MKKTDYAGRQGYVNEYGIFFDGDYETARAKMDEWDLKVADTKMKQQKQEQSYEDIMNGEEMKLIKRAINGEESVDVLCRYCSSATEIK